MTEQDEELKRIWKQDADQMKADKANLPKAVQYNPKAIKFGGASTTKKSSPKGQQPKGTSLDDLYWRGKLGL